MNADFSGAAVPNSELAANPQVLRFAEAARRYCALIDAHARMSPLELVTGANRALVELHLAALDLPNVESGDDVRGNRLTDRQWSELYRSLGQKLGEWNLYWTVFDSYVNEGSLCSSLADDLADIYRDIDDGLKLFDQGSEAHVREAIWDWKFGFESHWGRHLVHSLSAMHCILAEHASNA